MPTINTESIQGFAEMTAEDQVKALLGYEFDDGTAKIKAAEDKAASMKAAFDKASSEAAGYKKQLHAKMTDEELKKQESENALKAIQDELAESKQKLAEFEQRERMSTAKAAFLGGGFDETTAADAANAFIEGDIEKMSAALKKFRDSIETATKSKLMGSNPRPESGSKTDDESGKDESVAVRLGKQRAETAKKAQSIIESYIRR